MAPNIQAVSGKLIKYKQIIQRESENFKLENETFDANVYKSEVWFTGKCISLCPGNCTNNVGGDAEWSYVQKTFNPVKADFKILDVSLKVVCKGNGF